VAANQSSLELIAAEVRAERDVLVRHADAVDAKAGIVLGFAGATAAIGGAQLGEWALPAIAVASYAAFRCLMIFRPDRYPSLELRRLRDRYLTSEPSFTRLTLLDTQIAMGERQIRVLDGNARHLSAAVRALAAEIPLLVAGTIGVIIGG